MRQSTAMNKQLQVKMSRQLKDILNKEVLKRKISITDLINDLYSVAMNELDKDYLQEIVYNYIFSKYAVDDRTTVSYYNTLAFKTRMKDFCKKLNIKQIYLISALIINIDVVLPIVDDDDEGADDNEKR